MPFLLLGCPSPKGCVKGHHLPEAFQGPLPWLARRAHQGLMCFLVGCLSPLEGELRQPGQVHPGWLHHQAVLHHTAWVTGAPRAHPPAALFLPPPLPPPPSRWGTRGSAKYTDQRWRQQLGFPSGTPSAPRGELCRSPVNAVTAGSRPQPGPPKFRDVPQEGRACH